MRHRDNYCFISCGPNGQNGVGGHNHNDKLSFELMLNGRDIIVDPGTYVYTPYPEWRNTFRSTAYHNTVKIDDREQNDISKDLFEMGQGTECKNCRLNETEELIVFEGEVNYLRDNIIHRRKVILHKNKSAFDIFDEVKSPFSHSVLVNLCLGNYASNYDISLGKGILEEAEGFYSSEYGSSEEAVFLRNVTEGCTDFSKKISIREKQDRTNEHRKEIGFQN
jgi:hypothetical protein